MTDQTINMLYMPDLPQYMACRRLIGLEIDVQRYFIFPASISSNTLGVYCMRSSHDTDNQVDSAIRPKTRILGVSRIDILWPMSRVLVVVDSSRFGKNPKSPRRPFK